MREWTSEVQTTTAMSDTEHGAHGAADAHGTGHGHDDHGHAADTLGPIDWPRWMVGVLGVLVAAVMVVGFVMGTGGNFGL
jgi:hypothetical protein